jgi:hypothetical protein
MLNTQQMIQQEGYQVYRDSGTGIEILARCDHEQDTVWIAPLIPTPDGRFGSSEFWTITTLINDIWDSYRNHEYTIEIDNVEAFNYWFKEAAE